MNITDGIYTDFRKLEQGVKLYMKISQPIAYATLKLVQFLQDLLKKNISARIWSKILLNL